MGNYKQLGNGCLGYALELFASLRGAVHSKTVHRGDNVLQRLSCSLCHVSRGQNKESASYPLIGTGGFAWAFRLCIAGLVVLCIFAQSALAGTKPPPADQSEVPLQEAPFAPVLPRNGLNRHGSDGVSTSKASVGVQALQLQRAEAQVVPRALALKSCTAQAQRELEAGVAALPECGPWIRDTMAGELSGGGCIDRVMREGNGLNVSYKFTERSKSGRSKVRFGVDMTGRILWSCNVAKRDGFSKAFVVSRAENKKAWSFSTVRVGGNVVINDGVFETQTKVVTPPISEDRTKQKIRLYSAKINFSPRFRGASPYSTQCSGLSRAKCKTWRKVGLEYYGSFMPYDGGEDAERDGFSFSNDAEIAYQYTSLGSLKPKPASIWLLRDSFEGSFYGNPFGAAVEGSGPGLCDWKEKDYDYEKGGYNRNNLDLIAKTIRVGIPELPPVLPMEYDLNVRPFACTACGIQGHCDGRPLTPVD